MNVRNREGRQKTKLFVFGIIAVFLLLAFDQITKYFAQSLLSGKQGVPVIPGVFHLFYLENRGAAFGMFANKQAFFVLIAVLMTAAAIYVYARLPVSGHYHFLRAVCLLIAAGAVGNMLDRILHNYVIDFLYFSLIDFPVFNVADCYVCIGAALGVLMIFTLYKEDDFGFLMPFEHSRKRG